MGRLEGWQAGRSELEDRKVGGLEGRKAGKLAGRSEGRKVGGFIWFLIYSRVGYYAV